MKTRGLLAQLPERFGVEIHAFLLVDNHYHVLLRTPEPNLSHAFHWPSYRCGDERCPAPSRWGR